MASAVWMKRLSLTTSGTKYNLWTLMQAKDGTLSSGRCAQLTIEYDPGNGSGNIYVGNDDITTTNYGDKLTAARQTTIIGPSNDDWISLADIWLQGDASPMLVCITATFR